MRYEWINHTRSFLEDSARKSRKRFWRGTDNESDFIKVVKKIASAPNAELKNNSSVSP